MDTIDRANELVQSYEEGLSKSTEEERAASKKFFDEVDRLTKLLDEGRITWDEMMKGVDEARILAGASIGAHKTLGSPSDIPRTKPQKDDIPPHLNYPEDPDDPDGPEDDEHGYNYHHVNDNTQSPTIIGGNPMDPLKDEKD